MKIIWIILALLYTLSPIDLLPEALLGGWGWLEDIVLLFFLWNYLRGGVNPLGMFRHRQQQQANRRAGPNSNNNRKDSAEQTKTHQTNLDPYAVLGISEQSSLEEINLAYRNLAAKYHPDKVQHLGEEFHQLAETRFKEIQKAYQQIKKKRSK